VKFVFVFSLFLCRSADQNMHSMKAKERQWEVSWCSESAASRTPPTLRRNALVPLVFKATLPPKGKSAFHTFYAIEPKLADIV